jgi:hypothetical protein
MKLIINVYYFVFAIYFFKKYNFQTKYILIKNQLKDEYNIIYLCFLYFNFIQIFWFISFYGSYYYFLSLSNYIFYNFYYYFLSYAYLLLFDSSFIYSFYNLFYSFISLGAY